MFYKLSHTGSRQNKYVCKNLSILGCEESICQSCGREIPNIIYDEHDRYRLLINGGKKFPDILEYAYVGPRLFIISERTLSLFLQEQVSGIMSYELVRLFIREGKDIVPVDPAVGKYYVLHLSGSIELNYPAMFLKKKRVCNDCGKYDLNRQRSIPYVVDSETWNKCELCTVKTFPWAVICTERIVKMIKKNRLKGFVYEPLKEESTT